MRTRLLFATLLSLTLARALAQPAAGTDDDFKEIETPPAPVYHKEGLIAIDMPSSGSLKYGLDPVTLSIGSDGVVRYVMVAYNPSGSVNALYEGLRCETGEVKTYARSSELGRWTTVQQPTWRRVENNASSRHTLALAKQGMCDIGRLATTNVTEMVRLLRTPTTSQTPY
jgi:CNP1-like family